MGFATIFYFAIFLFASSLYLIYTMNMNWSSCQLFSINESIQNTLINESPYICLFRIFAALIHWVSMLYILFDRDGLKINVLMRNGSLKLLHLKHIERFTPFTVWCWSVQGFYFGIVSLLSLIRIYYSSILATNISANGYLCSFLWILFEISFTASFLVSTVVTYVLIPGMKSKGAELADPFFQFFPLLFHNVNVILISAEAMLSNISFGFWHFPFIVIYGALYVVFAWYWFHKRGVFYYFFLDYENKYALVWHIGLMIVVRQII